MRTTAHGLNRWHALLGLLIAYGSLYPFDFSPPAAPSSALQAFLTTASLWSNPADVLGNILLFLPWGLATNRPPVADQASRAGLQALLAGALLAIVLQLLQLGLPSRDAALSDVFWNLAGLLAGYRLRPHLPQALDAATPAQQLAVVLILGGCLIQAWPLLPALEPAQPMRALRAMLTPAPGSVLRALEACAIALVCALALRSLLAPRHLLPVLAGGLGALLLLRLWVPGATPHWHEVLGGATACASLPLLRSARTNALAAFPILLGTTTLAALAPFQLSWPAGSFQWLPLLAYLEGGLAGNLGEALHTLWTTAALLWLAHLMGARLGGITVFLVLWTLALEIIQLWLPGRSADISPVLLTALSGLVMRRTLAGLPAAAFDPPPAPRAPPAPTAAARMPARASAFIVLWLGGSLLLAWLIRLPGVPYNLRELLAGNGHPLAIAVFMLALLWLGAGVRLALEHALRRPGPALRLPLALCLSGLVSLVLLASSVTTESLDDLTGATNMYWWITEGGRWGVWPADILRSLPQGALLSALIERSLRYLALYLPPAAFLAVALAVADKRLEGRRLAVLILGLLPWLWLAKAIAFDGSSTDNLNELIARNGFFGLGGGVALYLLLALFSANVALLRQIRHHPWRALLSGLAALPLSWWLLNLGLEAGVEKYALRYSATQFLLGADRLQLLDAASLQLRWAAVYLTMAGVVSFGVALAGTPQASPIRRPGA